jgi:hypothetical protein
MTPHLASTHKGIIAGIVGWAALWQPTAQRRRGWWVAQEQPTLRAIRLALSNKGISACPINLCNLWLLVLPQISRKTFTQ